MTISAHPQQQTAPIMEQAMQDLHRSLAQALELAVSHHQFGQFEDAENLYRTILEAQPNHPDANHNLGVLAVQMGQAGAGLPYFSVALGAKPEQQQYWSSYIDALIQADETETARQVLELAHQHGLHDDEVEVFATRLEGNAQTMQQTDAVPQSIVAALESVALQSDQKQIKLRASTPRKPTKQAVPFKGDGKAGSPQEISTLVALYSQGRLIELETLARALTVRFPMHGVFWKALGVVTRQHGRMDEALGAMRKAVELLPEDAEAHGNLGVILQERGRLAEAEASLLQALEIKPDYVEAHYNLANALQEQGKLSEAEVSFRRALVIKPDYVEAHSNLGVALKDQGRLQEAVASFRRALEIKPDYVHAHSNLGVIFQSQGQLIEAEASLSRALEIQPDALQNAVHAHLLLPIIHESLDAMIASRECYQAGLSALMDASGTLEDPGRNTNLSSFYLAYHNLNDRLVMESLRRLFRTRVAGLTAAAPHVSGWQSPVVASRRIRVGFLSEFLVEHTIGKLYQGFIRHLDRSRFEVVIIHTLKAKRDAFRQSLDALADNVVTLPARLIDQQQAVAAEALDVLFYPDIGMTPTTYFLAYARLAPVQAVGWGHPDTTGLDTIDYFVSAAAIEPDDAQSHYTERLIRLNRLPCYYPPVIGPTEIPTRAALGLPETGTLYGCPQTLFKFHPDFDAILATIVEGDPTGRIVLLEGDTPAWVKLLRARWAKTFPILLSRVLFLSRMPLDHFIALIAHMDVLLDPIHFGSGNTVYEGMVHGTPVVTWPGQFMRGRIAAAAYRQMAVADAPIVSRLEDYAPLALAFGCDPERRRKLREASKEAASRELFSDKEAVREFEAFLEAAVVAAGRGDLLPIGWRPDIQAGQTQGASVMAPRPIIEQALVTAVEKVLQLAVNHHQSGQFENAENLYRTILEAQPDHPVANHNMGFLAVQAKQAGASLPYFAAALEAKPEQERYWLSYIDALIQADEAEAARQVLMLGRQHGLQGAAVEVLEVRLDGGIQTTQQADAVTQFVVAMPELAAPQSDKKQIKLKASPSGKPDRQGVRHKAPSAKKINALMALYGKGRIAEAEALTRSFTTRFPGYGFGWKALGALLQQQGRVGEALVPTQKGAQLLPGDAEAHSNLGILLQNQGQLSEAETSYLRALTIKPNFAEAHSNLGVILHAQGRLNEAEASLRRALEINLDYAEAHYNLGNALQAQGRPSESEASFRRAVQINPDFAEAHGNLGNILNDLGRLLESESSFRRTLELRPDDARSHSNLGNILKDLGRLSEAEVSYRQALKIQPDYAVAHSNLLFSMNYSASHATSYCLEVARQYGRMVDKDTGEIFSTWQCASRPERLRVGLVSGDLRQHSVGFFMESLLAHIDLERIELIAYPTYHSADALTARIQPHFAAWKPLLGQSDETAARLIHADGVHVLLDLSGHSAHNRLPVFGWKPAPVQASWLGYFATTGVAQMDYVLGDPYVTPDEEQDHFTESVWRLPESYLCFTPPDVVLEVGPLPGLLSGCITFGCFNNLAKMNDAVVALWARVLLAVPGSRLFLKTNQLNDPVACESTRCRFAERGIAADRLLLEGASPRAELLAAYHRVDIALDPFPYPGGTTSVEGLWMGVPVITRRGDRFLSHVGESIAHNAGLTDWIAADDDDYVNKVVAHAGDIERLARLRLGLRQQVLASPVFDAPRFARSFEAALWGMWQNWQMHQGIST